MRTDETMIAGVFCEDIREEKAGTETLVGVLPDNVNMPVVPGVMPKLAVYLRVLLDPDNPPEGIKTYLRTPWGQTIDLGFADSALVKMAIEQANANHLPLAGVVIKGLMSPFAVQSAGTILAIANVDGRDIVCAMLNIVVPASA